MVRTHVPRRHMLHSAPHPRAGTAFTLRHVLVGLLQHGHNLVVLHGDQRVLLICGARGTVGA